MNESTELTRRLPTFGPRIMLPSWGTNGPNQYLVENSISILGDILSHKTHVNITEFYQEMRLINEGDRNNSVFFILGSKIDGAKSAFTIWLKSSGNLIYFDFIFDGSKTENYPSDHDSRIGSLYMISRLATRYE